MSVKEREIIVVAAVQRLTNPAVRLGQGRHDGCSTHPDVDGDRRRAGRLPSAGSRRRLQRTHQEGTSTGLRRRHRYVIAHHRDVRSFIDKSTNATYAGLIKRNNKSELMLVSSATA